MCVCVCVWQTLFKHVILKLFLNEYWHLVTHCCNRLHSSNAVDKYEIRYYSVRSLSPSTISSTSKDLVNRKVIKNSTELVTSPSERNVAHYSISFVIHYSRFPKIS